MGVSSSEYNQLRERLAGWFNDAHLFPEPVFAKELGLDPNNAPAAWEVRAGFVGDACLGYTGLAVVVRRRLGMENRRRIYRADVFEPQGERVLPRPDVRAGRIEYKASSAGYIYSEYPDAPPASEATELQFRAMHAFLEHMQPAPSAAIAVWAKEYENLSPLDFIPPQLPKRRPFLGLIANELFREQDS